MSYHHYLSRKKTLKHLKIPFSSKVESLARISLRTFFYQKDPNKKIYKIHLCCDTKIYFVSPKKLCSNSLNFTRFCEKGTIIFCSKALTPIPIYYQYLCGKESKESEREHKKVLDYCAIQSTSQRRHHIYNTNVFVVSCALRHIALYKFFNREKIFIAFGCENFRSVEKLLNEKKL